MKFRFTERTIYDVHYDHESDPYLAYVPIKNTKIFRSTTMFHRRLFPMRVVSAAPCHRLQDAVARLLVQRQYDSAGRAIAVNTHSLRRFHGRAQSGSAATRSCPPLSLMHLTAASAAGSRPSRLASATTTVSILPAGGSGRGDESVLWWSSPRRNRCAQVSCCTSTENRRVSLTAGTQ